MLERNVTCDSLITHIDNRQQLTINLIAIECHGLGVSGHIRRVDAILDKQRIGKGPNLATREFHLVNTREVQHIDKATLLTLGSVVVCHLEAHIRELTHSTLVVDTWLEAYGKCGILL